MKMHRLAVAAMTTLLAFGATAPAFAAGDRDHDRGRQPTGRCRNRSFGRGRSK